MFYKNKHVLVTGGSGFIGTHLIEALLRQGARVRVTVHKRALNLSSKRLEVSAADLSREKDCLRCVKGIDYVFHCAGSTGGSGVGFPGALTAIANNLTLSAQMLKAAGSSEVKRFLIFSSSTVYPAVSHPVKEEEAWEGPVHPSYFGYGWMRRYIERLGELVAMNTPLQIALIRPTAVYGRWDNFNPDTSHVIPALVRKAIEKRDPYEVWGSGEEERDFLHVTDLASGCLLALEKYACCKPINIGFGAAVRIKEAVNIILKQAGYTKARVVFNAAKPASIPVRAVDIHKARTLGFNPKVSLEEGLRDTVMWYKRKCADISLKKMSL